MIYAKTVFFFCLVSQSQCSSIPRAVRARHQVSLSKDSEVPEARLHTSWRALRRDDEIAVRQRPFDEGGNSLQRLARLISMFEQLEITEVDNEDIVDAAVSIRECSVAVIPLATECHRALARYSTVDDEYVSVVGRVTHQALSFARFTAPLHAIISVYLLESLYKGNSGVMRYRCGVTGIVLSAESVSFIIYVSRGPIRMVDFLGRPRYNRFELYAFLIVWKSALLLHLLVSNVSH